MKLVIHRFQRPSPAPFLSTGSFISEITMSDKKRKATSAAAAPEPRAKQQKLEGKKERAGGWLQSLVQEQRSEKKEIKFNKKRLRFISDAEKVKQGSEGVLYWMLRDHRVQGKHRPQPTL